MTTLMWAAGNGRDAAADVRAGARGTPYRELRAPKRLLFLPNAAILAAEGMSEGTSKMRKKREKLSERPASVSALGCALIILSRQRPPWMGICRFSPPPLSLPPFVLVDLASLPAR